MRQQLGLLGSLGTPLLTWQCPLRLGFSVDDCCPIGGLRAYANPVLLIAGAKDPHTPPAESRRMFEAAQGPKVLWMVDKVGHADYHAVAPAQYEAKVLSFLARHL